MRKKTATYNQVELGSNLVRYKWD